MKSVKFIDEALRKTGAKNDLALSKILGWSSGQISQYRHGKRFMDNEACIALALVLEIEPWKIIMAADIDRAAKAGQKSLWEVFSLRTATAAAALMVTSVNLFLTPAPAEAAPVLKPTSGKLYIMSNRLRRLLSKMAAWIAPATATATL